MKKRSLVCILVILMMACFTAANIALADTVADLSKCVSGYNVVDVKGKKVSTGTKVNTTDVYAFKVFFEETSKGNQFADPAYYELPEGVTLARDFSNVPILLDDKVTVVGYVSGNVAANKLTVDFLTFPKDGKDVPWPELALESEMNVEFEGYFAGTKDENPKTINFGNSQELKVDLKVGAALTVEKTAGSYDSATQTISYTVKTTANGKIKNAVLTDAHESGLSLVTDSVKVAGTSATATIDSATQFTVPVGDLNSGESVTVTYTMKVDPNELIKKDYVEHTFKNTATVKGKNGGKDISGSGDAEKRVNQSNMKKSGSETTLSGTPVFKWAITVGDKNLGVDIGGTLVDTPDSRQTLYTGSGTPAGGPIEVKYEMAGGTKGTVYADSLDSIVIPAGAVKADISYYTTYSGQNPVGKTTYTNEASLTVRGNPWSTKGNVSVDGTDPGISKTYTNVTPGTDGTITYQVELDVPAGTDQTGVFYLYDTLKTDTGSGSSKDTGNRPTVSSITVNGAAYTDYTVLQGDQASKDPDGGTSSFDHDFYILFGGTDLTSTNQSVWAETADAKVIITYSIPRSETLKDTSDTIDSALKNGATLRNTAALYFSPEGKVEAYKDYTENSNQTMEKSTVKVDPVEHTVEYKVVFTLDMVGKNGDECYFAFVDTFDERFEFVDDSFSITKDDGKKYICRTNTSDNKKWAKGNVLTVPAKELYPNGNKDAYRLSRDLKKSDVLTATYKLKIKDDEYNKIDWSSLKTATIDFVNSAMAGMVNDDNTITPIVADNNVTPYPTGLITKEAQLRDGKGDMLDYLIAINPDGLDLIDGTDQLTVTDTFQTANLALQPETIKVENLTTGQPIMDCWQIRSGGQEIVFTIPDETAVGISYATKVTEYGDNVRVANEVTISGILDGTILYEESMKIAREDSGATSKHGQFTLFKYDEDSGEPLKGAKFALYTTKTNDVDLTKTYKYGNTTYYLATEVEVGDAGYVLVDHVVLTLKDADTYLLVETETPSGYEKLTDPIEFTFNPATEVANIPVMHEGNLSVANKKLPGVTVSLGGNKTLKNLSPDIPLDVEFTLLLYEDGTVIDNAKVGRSGSYRFKDITYATTGDHEYTVAEQTGNLSWITYDQKSYTFTVSVAENTAGELVATITGDTTTGDDLNFTNLYAPKGSIQPEAEKQIEGRPMTTTDCFSFTITENGKPVSTGNNNGTPSITFTGIEYELADVGKHTYVIAEDDTTVKGITKDATTKTWTVMVSDNRDGTLSAVTVAAETDSLTFTNTYGATTSIQPEAKKELKGRVMTTTDNFSFTITENGTPVSTGNNNGDASVTFTEIVYTQEDVGTHTYVISEDDTTLPGITKDITTNTWTVLVSDNGDGTLSAVTVAAETDSLTFTNTYGATTSIQPEAKKELKGRVMTTTDNFSFTITENGTPVSTGNNNGKASVTFTEIVYTQEDVGTHTYVISEDDTTLPGITKDITTKTWTVLVSDNGDGTLSAVTVAAETDSLTFTNLYEAEGSMDLQAFKYMKAVGSVPAANEKFDFVLEKEDGTSTTVQNGENGLVDFGTVAYTLEDIGTHVYKIREKQLVNGNYITDPTLYEVTVTVSDNGDGTLKVARTVKRTDGDGTVTDLTEDAKLTFVNDYKTCITLFKQWQGGEEDEITLTLYAGDKVVPETETVTDPETGKPIEKINYVLTRDGYQYTFSQLEPRNPDNSMITYGVKEKGISGYLRIYQNVGEYKGKSDYVYDEGTIINRAVTSIRVRKVWEGVSDESKRPDITLTLYCNGSVYNRKPSGPNKDGWYTWSNLPREYEGRDAVYYVVEEPLPAFRTTYTNVGMESDVTDRAYDGGTITNLGIPKTGDASHPILWTLLAVLGLAGSVMLVCGRMKRAHR